MTLSDVILILILLLIVGGAILYIRKEKKRGVKCVGCPYAESCASRTNGNCSGGRHTEKK